MSETNLANNSSLSPLMREIEPMIERITLPNVRETVSNIAQLLATNSAKTGFRCVLRVTKAGQCAAFYTNKRQVGAPVGCSFIDIDQGNTVLAWGEFGVFSCRGDDAGAISNIVNVIRPQPDESICPSIVSRSLAAN